MTSNEQNESFDHTLIQDFNLETFAPYVNSKFTVTLEGHQACELELVEAKELRYYEGAPRKDPFSLLFSGPKEYALQQGTYNLQHETIGTFPLFLIPILPDENANYFESIFN